VWRAAFDRAIDAGMSEKAAARYALKITRRTQPFFSVKEVPDFWRSGEGFRMLTMFQNQLMHNFNYIRTFIISEMKHQRISKAEAIRRLIQGIIIPAMLIGIISYSRLPKDAADFAKMTAAPLVAIFPLIGPIFSGAIQGFYDTTTPVTFQALQQASEAVYQAAKGQWDKFLREIPEVVGMATGLPTVAPKRFIQAVISIASGKSDDWLELIWGTYIRERARKETEEYKGGLRPPQGLKQPSGLRPPK
jgi:hypothetical protein